MMSTLKQLGEGLVISYLSISEKRNSVCVATVNDVGSRAAKRGISYILP